MRRASNTCSFSCSWPSRPARLSGIPPRPNIVVVLVDDLRWDDIAVAGHPFVETPNIDRLAREGARFLNAFAATPLCSPSRATMLTGQHTHTNGIIDNTARDSASHGCRPLPSRSSSRVSDRIYRQVAHGQRRHAASGVDALGRDEEARARRSIRS